MAYIIKTKVGQRALEQALNQITPILIQPLKKIKPAVNICCGRGIIFFSGIGTKKQHFFFQQITSHPK